MGRTDHEEETGIRDRDLELSRRMARAQAGDTAAFRALLEEIQPMLKSFHSRTLRRFGLHSPQAVDDLTQETLLAIHRRRATYDSTLPFGPWLYAIARHKLIDHGRRARREILVDDWEALVRDIPAGTSAGAGAGAGTGEEAFRADELEALLTGLKPEQRRLLERVKIDGISVRDASRETGLSESAVKVRIHRTLAALRARVSREMDEGADR